MRFNPIRKAHAADSDLPYHYKSLHYPPFSIKALFLAISAKVIVATESPKPIYFLFLSQPVSS